MKKLLLAVFLLISTNEIFSQINKGQWLVGGTAGFESYKQGDSDDDKSTSIWISPNAGYFFIDQLAGGLRLSFSRDKTKSDDDAYSEFGIAPFLRYYFLNPAQKINVFADAHYGFISAGYDDKESGNQFGIMAGPAIFLSPNTALELALYYNSRGGDVFENAAGDRQNRFGLSIGFQIHLGGK